MTSVAQSARKYTFYQLPLHPPKRKLPSLRLHLRSHNLKHSTTQSPVPHWPAATFCNNNILAREKIPLRLLLRSMPWRKSVLARPDLPRTLKSKAASLLAGRLL